MTSLSIALLSLAEVLVLLYVPLLFAVGAASGPSGEGDAVGLLSLVLLRVVVLLAGFLTAVPTGRLAPIAPTVGGQLAACVFAVLLVEAAANWALWATLYGPRSNGLGVVGGLLAVALPGLLAGAGLCALLTGGRHPWAGPLFWGSFVASVVCWAVAGSAADTRHLEANEKFRQIRQQEEQQQVQQQVQQAEEELPEKSAAIARTAVTDTEGLETLLAYTSHWQRGDVSELAAARIRTAERYPERLAAILTNGKNRIEALGILAQDAKGLPPGVERECWRALEGFAGEMLRDLEGGQADPPLDALFRPALDFMNAQADARKQHRGELLAVQKVVRKADEQHKIFSLEAMMRLRDIDHPQGDWAEAAQVGSP